MGHDTHPLKHCSSTPLHYPLLRDSIVLWLLGLTSDERNFKWCSLPRIARILTCCHPTSSAAARAGARHEDGEGGAWSQVNAVGGHGGGRGGAHRQRYLQQVHDRLDGVAQRNHLLLGLEEGLSDLLLAAVWVLDTAPPMSKTTPVWPASAAPEANWPRLAGPRCRPGHPLTLVKPARRRTMMG